jgi:hypothetical protein
VSNNEQRGQIMNNNGIELFLSRIGTDDYVSVSFTNGEESASYYGKVLEVNEKTVTIENKREMDFFEALAYPQFLEVPLRKVWFYSIKKPDGTEVYC